MANDSAEAETWVPLSTRSCYLQTRGGRGTIYPRSGEPGRRARRFQKRNGTCLLNSLLLDELQVIFCTYPVGPHSGLAFCQERMAC